MWYPHSMESQKGRGKYLAIYIVYWSGVFVKEDRTRVSKKLDIDKFLVGQSDLELTGKYVRCHLQQRFTFFSELF